MSDRIILGIDPGSRETGYALLSVESGRHRVLACHTISSASIKDHTERLKHIYKEVTALINRYNPTDCAVETPVYGIDPLAMLKLGRAQAAALLAFTNMDLPVSEYYPKAIKKSVTGNGNASKKQVAYMLGKLLDLPDKTLTADATDALAVAWTHHLHLDHPLMNKKAYHQNNRKSGWAAFIEANPDRVKE